MSNEFEYEPVTNAAGEAVSEQDLHDGLHKPFPIKFDYNGYKGFTAWFVRSKIPTAAVLRLQSAVSELLAKRPASDEDEASDIEVLMDATKGLSEEEAAAKIGPENQARLLAYYKKIGLQNSKDEPVLFPIKVEMLAPAIVAWNVPGEVPSVDTFQNNGALAMAVIPKAWSHYRNFTTGSAAAAETTPTASTASSATTSPSAATKAASRRGS